MLLEVRHVTHYHYAAPVRESVMELWMQPQKAATQRLLGFELEIEPAAQLFSYPDSFGNAVYHFDVPHPHEQLQIVARSAVVATSGMLRSTSSASASHDCASCRNCAFIPVEWVSADRLVTSIAISR